MEVSEKPQHLSNWSSHAFVAKIPVCKTGTCQADFGFCIPRYLKEITGLSSSNSLRLGHSGIEDKFTSVPHHINVNLRKKLQDFLLLEGFPNPEFYCYVSVPHHINVNLRKKLQDFLLLEGFPTTNSTAMYP